MEKIEIKFRAWDGKEMHLKVCVNHEGKFIKYGYRATDWVEDASAGIGMQFTGLLDRNGKEIYEGDIIEVDDIESTKGTIVFDEGCFKLLQKDTYYSNLSAYNPSVMCRVAGNIYENPELLTNQK